MLVSHLHLYIVSRLFVDTKYRPSYIFARGLYQLVICDNNINFRSPFFITSLAHLLCGLSRARQNLLRDTCGCASLFHALAPLRVNFKVAADDPTVAVFLSNYRPGDQSTSEWLDKVCTTTEKCYFCGNQRWELCFRSASGLEARCYTRQVCFRAISRHRNSRHHSVA